MPGPLVVIFFSLPIPLMLRHSWKKKWAAATIYGEENTSHDSPNLNIAFDGDAVLFSDEAEIINEKHGVKEFGKAEKQICE